MTVRVTLVGAGIVGAAAADQLALAGARVTLVDAGVPGRGTSATSLAWVNANNQPRSYFDFRVAAMRAWTDVAAEFGGPAWYQPSGNVAWTINSDDKAELHERVERLREWDYPATVVTPSRASELEPQLRIPTDAAIAHFPSEGWVDGAGAADALTNRAQAHGAAIVPNDPVVAIDTRAGRVATVRLASGAAVECDVIVCCAGWRSGEIAQLVGAELPIVDTAAASSRAHCAVATTVPTAARPSGVVHGPDLYLRPTADGGVWLEASDVDATVDRTTTDSQLQAAADVLLDRARAVVPALADTELQAARRCIRRSPTMAFPSWDGTPASTASTSPSPTAGSPSPLISDASSPRTSSTATLPPSAPTGPTDSRHWCDDSERCAARSAATGRPSDASQGWPTREVTRGRRRCPGISDADSGPSGPCLDE